MVAAIGIRKIPRCPRNTTPNTGSVKRSKGRAGFSGVIKADEPGDGKDERRHESRAVFGGPQRLPAAQEQERRDAGDGHHVGVFGHEERGELHAAVFGVESGDQLVFSLGQIERHAVGFGERGDQKNDETDDLRERSLKNRSSGE